MYIYIYMYILTDTYTYVSQSHSLERPCRLCLGEALDVAPQPGQRELMRLMIKICSTQKKEYRPYDYHSLGSLR